MWIIFRNLKKTFVKLGKMENDKIKEKVEMLAIFATH